MSNNSFRPLAEFPHADELLLAIRTLRHRFPAFPQGRHVWVSASTTGPDIAILTLKYGAIPCPEIRHLYPFDQVPESELHAMEYLNRKLGWRFHESASTVPKPARFMELVNPPSSEETREARLQIRSELGIPIDEAGDPTRMVSAESLFPIRVPAPPQKMPKKWRTPPQIESRERDYVMGEVAYQLHADMERAKRHFETAARRGHTKAQHRLATIYSGERAYSTAIKWCRLAAWQGRLPEAQFDLAVMYYYGRGAAPDLREATKWMLQAAEGANASAMHGMGVLSTDPVERFAWFKLAAGRRVAESVEAAKGIRPSLNREQLARAKALMAELRARIHQPSKRANRPKRGPKHYVGSQEMDGGVCEWRVEYSLRRFGDDDWILYVRGEEGGTDDQGPMSPDELLETLEDRGLDTHVFVKQLRASGEPTLMRLANEIERLTGRE